MILNPYLNFAGKTEEAFNFYHSVFGGEAPEFMRFKDTPHGDQMPENERDLIMHVALNIGKENMLMGTDMVDSMGQKLAEGNNMSLSLHPDTKEEADKLFKALSEGGTVEMPMEEVFWGDYYGMLKDKFGIRWMINLAKK